ncbi:MAG: hypothetical protein JSR36_07450 [Proteobacteria bacterium]|nr:hypothetical protein [Pseudomonadota bacterium]
MQLLHFPPRQTPGEDVSSAYLEICTGAPFCANPDCALHLRVIDERVSGDGNRVVLPDGRTFGRSRHGAVLLCDACGTRRGPVRIAAAGRRN